MILAVAIHGALGRMGRQVARAALADRRFRIAAAVVSPRDPHLGRDYGEVLGAGPLGIPVSAHLEGEADVLVDFTTPAAAAGILDECVRRRLPMVVGTTGIDEAGLEGYRRAARTLPILISPNLSFGVNLTLALVEQAARSLGMGFDAEIVEWHHKEKKDSPSGTAWLLARALAAARGQPDNAIRAGRSEGPRPAGEINVHAVRAGDLVGEHTVYFVGPGESVEITHRARSREIFARGALEMALRLVRRPPGLYRFRDLL